MKKILKLLKKPVRELLLVAIIFSALFPIIMRVHGGYGIQLLVHSIVTLALIIVTSVIVIWKNAEVIEVIARVQERHNIKPDGPLDVLLQKMLVDLIKRLDMVISENGVAITDDEQGVIVKACFASPFDGYLAVDSHCPSEYYKQYPQFLEDHQIGLQHNVRISWRILAVEQAVLMEDYKKHTVLFKKFVQWHVDKGVLIGQASPRQVRDFANAQKLGTLDMGLWNGRCSLLFFPPKSAAVPLRLRFLSPTDGFYNGCRLYFKNVASEDSKIILTSTGVKFETRDANERRDALSAI